ncbi:MAG TPA: alpha/beta fold hydrolase [Solirubrobacteraceae bacterium]|nr:alpha/beta fold hydrolase [Solirubrobacteraceae bacterium]
MDIPPTTHYTDSRGPSVAFQTFGEGPPLIVCLEIPSHLDLIWIDPGYTEVLRRLGSFATVVLFDRAGAGLSDPVDHVPAVEEFADDIEAVMDAAGVTSAHLFGSGTGTPGFAAFAARAPERVRTLTLWGAYHAGYRGPGRADHIARWGRDYDRVEAAWFQDVIPNWGKGHSLRFFAPGLDSDRLRRSMAMLERACAGPKMIQAISAAAWEADMRDVLPAIQSPTLVMASADSPQPPEHSRFAAELIPGATFEVLPASTETATLADYFGCAVDAIQRLITDGLSTPNTDRALATVMFTDIVGSTELAGSLGDERWRVLLDRHEQILRDHVEAAGGRLVGLTGDGSLSEFPGPARAIRCARAFSAAVRRLDIEVRAGLHTGECERVGDDLAGLAVHIAARVSAQAGPGEIWVSRTVRDLIAGSGIELRQRGTHPLKGVSGAWELFSVGDATATPTLPDDGHQSALADRLVLTAARRAPGLLRFAGRLAGQRSASRPSPADRSMD